MDRFQHSFPDSRKNTALLAGEIGSQSPKTRPSAQGTVLRILLSHNDGDPSPVISGGVPPDPPAADSEQPSPLLRLPVRGTGVTAGPLRCGSVAAHWDAQSRVPVLTPPPPLRHAGDANGLSPGVSDARPWRGLAEQCLRPGTPQSRSAGPRQTKIKAETMRGPLRSACRVPRAAPRRLRSAPGMSCLRRRVPYAAPVQ